MAILQTTTVSGNLVLPKGTTAQRPVSPAEGSIRYNTDLEYTEIYVRSNWERYTENELIDVKGVVTTVSGTHIENEDFGYRVHTFLSGTHTFTPIVSGNIEVLVVAGGGAGAGDTSTNVGNGGGGAGGVIYYSSYPVVAGTNYSVSVGAGGIGTNISNRVAGSNSVFGTITAIGGGGGGYYSNNNGGNGGSGGGGGATSSTGGAGTDGQGFDGAGGASNNGGGGGGAGGAATNRHGGPGLPFTISGTMRYYGGGGGGSASSVEQGVGGIGGGGDAGREGLDGYQNTGGGGGAQINSGLKAGNGGSGVVIVRYPTDTPQAVIHTFDEVGETFWWAPPGVTEVDVLVVGGGGGGGTDNSGGGGAGGLIYNTGYPVTPGFYYRVTVGAGGLGGPAVNTQATSGGNSVFDRITATGGGYGATGDAGTGYNGASGGSGGGGASEGTNGTGGAAVADGQGFPGGNSAAGGGGGGGGAGGPGQNGNVRGSTLGGAGGPGIPLAISGVVSWYAAGGDGGNENSVDNSRQRPSGIGGRTNTALSGTWSGIDGTGSGGAGVTHALTGNNEYNRYGGNGGSGTVIIRYTPPDLTRYYYAGWKQPSTSNIRGYLYHNNLVWQSENGQSGYSSVVWNQVFTGDFTLIASWQRDYRGIGMVYGPNVSIDDFTGYSADGTGPYFGALNTTGFVSGYSATFFGQYHAPITGGGAATTRYLFKWQRSGNTLTLQYSEKLPTGNWTNFNSASSVTISSGDKVICGAGEASGTEYSPLTFVSLTGS